MLEGFGEETDNNGSVSDGSVSDGSVSGMGTRDDAGFIPFGGGLLLQSADFFTPIVDDPYRFGQIAAANALSDIYAMGGDALTAMNLVGFPASLDLSVLRSILDGGQSKIDESGSRLCGGHSVKDEEPKYGLSVTGFVETEKVVRNAGAIEGDALVLTKPLGTGILTTALKRELISEEELEQTIQWAARLNKYAAAAMQQAGVSAATDVTGYGLLGHLSEMLDASGVGARLRLSGIPLLERAADLAAEGCYPGGLGDNRSYLGDTVRADGMADEDLLPLYDTQTSGGLLISAPQSSLPALLDALSEGGDEAAVIGEVVPEAGVTVTP